METCYVREVTSHTRVMKFCVFYPVFLLVPSAHFTVHLFWQKDVYVGRVGSILLLTVNDGIYMNEWTQE